MKVYQSKMFGGASPQIFKNAEVLRKKMTEAELILWEAIKNRKICNVTFRRQHPFKFYIFDFYCHKAKLVIELDGPIHLKSENKKYDEFRTEDVEVNGLEVIRFKNIEITENLDTVLIKIEEIVKLRLSILEDKKEN